MHMKTKAAILAAAAAIGLSTSAHAVTYVYVGKWSVGDGPSWGTNPPVYTGQQAAALLFGGSPSDYAISTIDSNPANINFSAHLDGWGDTRYLSGGNFAAQNYSLDTGGSGYNSNPGTSSAFSAYVRDHSNPGDTTTVNYAFLISGVAGAVPEPSTWAMMAFGLGVVGFALRKRPNVRTTISFA